jgi:predicted nucleic acid-binding protein
VSDRLILLDSGPLGLVTNPRESEQSRRCVAWMRTLLAGDSAVLVPEIADYEIRRELLRADRPEGTARLDDLADSLGLLPVTTAVWRRGAELWALARNEGYPTAADAALDGDVLLAAQAQLAAENGYEVIVATTNVDHLARFVDAREWAMITAF